jgi:hypothetical protein
VASALNTQFDTGRLREGFRFMESALRLSSTSVFFFFFSLQKLYYMELAV